MGILNTLFGKSISGISDKEFVRLIKDYDNGEPWAKAQLGNMWGKNDSALMSRINHARVQIYADAATRGDEHAQYMLGTSLISMDFNEAMKWLNPLIAKGNTEAMKTIGLQYTKLGHFGENDREYLKWFLRAAEAGDAEAQAKVALQYSIMGDKEKSCYWYKRAADQGNSDGLAGIADNKKNLLERRRIKPEKETVEEWATRNDQLYYEAERNYLSALNGAQTDVNYSAICVSLANLYEMFHDIYSEIEKAAYFYYESYLSGKNEFALDRFKGIRDRYHLDIDTSDMNKWAKKLKLIEE